MATQKLPAKKAYSSHQPPADLLSATHFRNAPKIFERLNSRRYLPLQPPQKHIRRFHSPLILLRNPKRPPQPRRLLSQFPQSDNLTTHPRLLHMPYLRRDRDQAENVEIQLHLLRLLYISSR